MTIYNELKSKFSKFYTDEVLAYKKQIDAMRAQLFFWEPLILLVILYFYRSNILGALFVIYAIVSIKRASLFDKRIKDHLMPKFCKALEPCAVLDWNDSNGKDVGYFENLFKGHNLFRLNKAYFSADDSFLCNFNGVDFEINEISNTPNLLQIFRKILGILLFGIIIPVFIGAFVMLIICGIILPIFGHPKSLEGFWAGVEILVFGGIPAVIISYKVISSMNLKLNLNILDMFKGLAVTFKYGKVKEGHTVIFENNVENIMVKNLLNSEYQKVELEDVEFNKVFSVYTTNQIEARYMLTTSMMERFLNLKMDFKSKYIRASFKDGELLLAIQSNKDLFRFGTILPYSQQKTFENVITEFVSILKITDELNLNSDTGL